MADQNPLTDEALVERMAAGEQEALAALYDRHRSVIFSLILRILRDRAEAEEVLTDVFFQAWRGAAGFDALRGTVIAWLVMLARSRALDRVRSRGRREANLAALVEEQSHAATQPSGGGAAAAEQEMRRSRIEAALGSLSPQQRGALELAYYGGLSHSEIAGRLGEPLGTIKSRMFTGLARLRELLEGETWATTPFTT